MRYYRAGSNTACAWIKMYITAFMFIAFGFVEALSQADTLALNFNHFGIREGLSQGMVNDILQDQYGFMWFATKDGLNRFDGYAFKVYRHEKEDSRSLCDSHVNALAEDSFGRLWVATANGVDVFLRDTETFLHIPCAGDSVGVQFAGADSLCNASVIQIAVDKRNRVWLGTDQGIFKIVVNEGIEFGLKAIHVEHFIKGDGNWLSCLDQKGRLWGRTKTAYFYINTNEDSHPIHQRYFADSKLDGVYPFHTELSVLGFVYDVKKDIMYCWNRQQIAVVNQETLGLTKIPQSGLDSLTFFEDSDGLEENGQWWVHKWYEKLVRYNSATNKTEYVKAVKPAHHALLRHITKIFRDRNDLLWFATSGYGLLTYDTRVERFHYTPGSSVRFISAGTNGDAVLDETNFLTVFDPKLHNRKIQLKQDEAMKLGHFNGVIASYDAVVQDDKGVYWFNTGGIMALDYSAQTLQRYFVKDIEGKEQDPTKTLFPLKLMADTLWMGGDDGFKWFDTQTKTSGTWAYPIQAVNNPYPFLEAIHRDADGVFWLGTVKGLFRFDRYRNEWKHFRNDPANDATLGADVIFSIEPGVGQASRYLWIGTNGGGLNKFDKLTGEVKRYTTSSSGLPNDVVYGVLTDDEGFLWMSTNKGIARFNPETEIFKNFNSGDGLQNDEFNRYAFCKLKGHELCFGGVSGFNTFNPAELKDDPNPAVVRIIDIKIKNQSVHFGGENDLMDKPAYLCKSISIPYEDHMITFEFANMEFSSSKSNTFMYMLEGFDRDWIDAGVANQATYTNLDPGEYKFLVKGSNRDKVWNTDATAFELVILPPWWMTWWFYTLVILSVAGSVLLYIFSLRRTVKIRTMELTLQKEVSDGLLDTILPQKVARELKTHGSVKAKQFHHTTIVFSGLKVIHDINQVVSAQDLLSELNICFNAFDSIIQKHRLEKIKTVGSTYLFAGGLEDSSAATAVDALRAALEMRSFIMNHSAERRARHQFYFELKSGLHTGSVVAGVVGIKKYSYDIWGDTVNTAARMESSCEEGQINVSAATHKQAQSYFEFVYRGKIAAKNKGEIDMYYVVRAL